MRKMHYIKFGASSTALIYMPAIDSLYEVSGDYKPYKSTPYHIMRLIGGLFFVSILLLFKYTILNTLLYISVYQCLMLFFIVKIGYQYLILSDKIYSLLKDNPKKIEIKYSKHFYTWMLNNTIVNAIILLGILGGISLAWINIDVFNFQAPEEEIITRGILILSFCFFGWAFGITDLSGRIKLLFRLKKEKRTLRK